MSNHDGPDLARPEPGSSFVFITHTDDRLGPGLVMVVEVDEDGVNAPVPGYMTLPVPLEEFRTREDEAR